MGEKITKAEFARRKRVTAQYVGRLCGKHILLVGKDGLLDWEDNDKLYEANKKDGYSRKQEAPDKVVQKAAQSAVDYNSARTAKEIANARLKELELQELEGKLVRIEDVRADASATGAELRVKLQSIAPRIATVCEGKEARQIERIIADEINHVLEVLQQSRYKND